jgi:hypothetical protein
VEVLRERDAAGFAADFVVRFAAVRPFAGAFAAVREELLREAAGFAFARVPLFAAGFAAALPAFFVAVRPEAARVAVLAPARVDVLRLDDFAAGFDADFAFDAGFAADFAAVRPFADAAFADVRDADFAAVRAGAFLAADFAVDFFAADFAVDFFAVDDLAVDVFALAAVPRADDERAVVLFAVLLFEAVLRDAGFFAPAADELRELDDREDERVAAAIVRVTSARPWVTSPIVASPHVASAISPPWVINDPPESICANGTPPAWFSTACTGRLSVRRPRGQHGQLLLVRDESLRDSIAFTCPKTQSVMHACARPIHPVDARRRSAESSSRS